MYKRKTYIITWFDARWPTPCAKSHYRYNCTRTVQGYSQAIRTAKRAARRYGVAILWDERGVIEPKNDNLDHWYINVYWG